VHVAVGERLEVVGEDERIAAVTLGDADLGRARVPSSVRGLMADVRPVLDDTPVRVRVPE